MNDDQKFWRNFIIRNLIIVVFSFTLGYLGAELLLKPFLR